MKLYLDPGHGGVDPGAIGNGISEKDIVLTLSKKIKAYIESNFENVEIMVTRDEDTFLSLTERTEKANVWGADFFLSLHINASTTPTAKGFESFVYTNVDSKTRALQNVMHEEIMRAIANVPGVQDRGKKQANFHVLRESDMPALLTENLFISNVGDSSLLKDNSFLDKLALGHCIGIQKFFGITRKPVAPIDTKLYQVVAGTFTNRENAQRRVDELKAVGYSAYIIEKN